MEPLSAKVVIAFFYLMNGELVSYTVSDYDSFTQEENIPPGRTCATLIQDVGFMEAVRAGLTPGETMRAGCYSTDDIMVLGDALATSTVTKP